MNRPLSLSLGLLCTLLLGSCVYDPLYSDHTTYYPGYGHDHYHGGYHNGVFSDFHVGFHGSSYRYRHTRCSHCDHYPCRGGHQTHYHTYYRNYKAPLHENRRSHYRDRSRPERSYVSSHRSTRTSPSGESSYDAKPASGYRRPTRSPGNPVSLPGRLEKVPTPNPQKPHKLASFPSSRSTTSPGKPASLPSQLEKIPTPNPQKPHKLASFPSSRPSSPPGRPGARPSPRPSSSPRTPSRSSSPSRSFEGAGGGSSSRKSSGPNKGTSSSRSQPGKRASR